MTFAKLTDAEKAEFIELLREKIDPELYTEDDLADLRASRLRPETPGVLGTANFAPEHIPEVWEPCDWQEEWPPSSLPLPPEF